VPARRSALGSHSLVDAGQVVHGRQATRQGINFAEIPAISATPRHVWGALRRGSEQP
jgi:hypothetical protein